MKSTTMVKLSTMGILLVSLLIRNFSLAYVDPVTPNPATAQLIGNTIQIVPTTTAATDFAECDSRGQPKSYYVGSQVAMKVQALPQGSNKRIVSTSRILKYDPYDVFNNFNFPTISYIVPTTIITQNKPVIVVDIDDNTTFKKPVAGYTRGQLAAQLSSNMHYQGVSTTSTSNTIDYTYWLLNETSSHTLSLFSNNLIQVIQQTYVCFDYYLAYCGDGVRDNYVAGGNGDGINGIMVDGSIVPWHGFTTATNPPAEECDDGNTDNNDACDNTCHLSTPQEPTCDTFTVNPTSGAPTQQFDFMCAGTNASSYELIVTQNGTTVSGYPLTTDVSPAIWEGAQFSGGSFSATCTVIGSDGTEVNCTSQPFTVIPTVNIAPTCNLAVSENTYGETGHFTCTVTNDAVLATTQPYTFDFTVNGSSVPTMTMPQTANTYDLMLTPAGAFSALCTVEGVSGLTGSCSTSFTVAPISQDTTLQIDKTIIPNPNVVNGLYRPGDTVTYRIDFSNIGSNIAHNVRVWDIFPNGLNYVSYQGVNIPTPNGHGTYSNGVNMIIEYSGFDLDPGESAYIIITGTLKGYAQLNETINISNAISDEADKVWDAVEFDFGMPTASVSALKTVSSSSVYPGGTIGFTITITNHGDDVENLSVTDIWPDPTCIIPGQNISSWTVPGTFAQGQTYTLYLTGQVANADACAGTYTNTVNYTYSLIDVVYNGTAQANFTVLPTPYANIDFSKTIVQAGSAAGDQVIYKLIYKNNGTNPLQGFVVTDYRPATLEFLSADPMPITVPPCSAGCTLQRPINVTLQPGEQGEITITGRIK